MNEKLEKFLGKTTTIYYGKDRHCRCGCGGRYARKGERTFKTYLTKIRKAIEKGEIREADADMSHARLDAACGPNNWDFVNIPVGTVDDNKCYCLYFD